MNTQEKIEFVNSLRDTIVKSKSCNKGRFVHDMNNAEGRLVRWVEYMDKHGTDNIAEELIELMIQDQNFINDCINENRRTSGRA